MSQHGAIDHRLEDELDEARHRNSVYAAALLLACDNDAGRAAELMRTAHAQLTPTAREHVAKFFRVR
jgi:hypothetical protein